MLPGEKEFEKNPKPYKDKASFKQETFLQMEKRRLNKKNPIKCKLVSSELVRFQS